MTQNGNNNNPNGKKTHLNIWCSSLSSSSLSLFAVFFSLFLWWHNGYMQCTDVYINLTWYYEAWHRRLWTSTSCNLNWTLVGTLCGQLICRKDENDLKRKTQEFTFHSNGFRMLNKINKRNLCPNTIKLMLPNESGCRSNDQIDVL